jgi:hypothetical protein
VDGGTPDGERFLDLGDCVLTAPTQLGQVRHCLADSLRRPALTRTLAPEGHASRAARGSGSNSNSTRVHRQDGLKQLSAPT